MKMIRIFAFYLQLISVCHLFGQNKISEQVIVSGLGIVVDIIFDDDNTMYVVEKRGQIQIIDSSGMKATSPFLDIRDRVNSSANERGLLGMALDPNFSANGYFYVHYTTLTQSIISRFSSDGNGSADPSSEQLILKIDQPFNNHNAGALHFGPEGYLYIAMGDGGSGGDPGNRSQNRLVLLGKMLRIDVSTLPYTIPADNPFADDDFTLDEIWALGLRNPWKFSFDQLTGDMYIADVGQKAWEEVNFVANDRTFGLNFGWRCYEGFEQFNISGCDDISIYEPPVHVYPNNENDQGCSITGGYVYRGSIPYLYGRYIYGDFCTGNIWALSRNDCGEWINELIYSISDQELSTFGQDKNGEMYIGKLGLGSITKIVELCDLSTTVNITLPTCGQANGAIEVTPSAVNAQVSITGDKFLGLTESNYDILVTDDQGCINRICVALTSADTFAYPNILAADEVKLCGDTSLLLTFNFLEPYTGLRMRLVKDSVHIVEDWDGTFDFKEEGCYGVIFYNDECEAPLQKIVDFSFLIPPPLEIQYIDNQLVASTGYSLYNWYENGQKLVGQTTNILPNPKPSTSYAVEGLLSEGCSNFSAEFLTTNIVDMAKAWGIAINPNPLSDFFEISMNSDLVGAIRMKIVNLEGKVIIEHILRQKNNRIDTQNWPNGHYIVSISDEINTITKHISIQR